MKIYKITKASEYLGVSINMLKTLANNNKINYFKMYHQYEVAIILGDKKLVFETGRLEEAGAAVKEIYDKVKLRVF